MKPLPHGRKKIFFGFWGGPIEILLPAKRNRCPQSGHPATRFLHSKNLGAVWIGAYKVGTESGKTIEFYKISILQN